MHPYSKFGRPWRVPVKRDTLRGAQLAAIDIVSIDEFFNEKIQKATLFQCIEYSDKNFRFKILNYFKIFFFNYDIWLEIEIFLRINVYKKIKNINYYYK